MSEWVNCPQPWPDCRPGACNCEGVADKAKHRGEDPFEARAKFIASFVNLTVTECETCNGRGYIEKWAGLDETSMPTSE